MENVCALILAAGKGTRMVSNHAKVLHEVCGVPMIRLIYRAVAGLNPEEIVVVVGQDADRVRACLEGEPCRFVLQAEQLGTGHAVLSARPVLAGRRGSVLVVSGDAPQIQTGTLRKLVQYHARSDAASTLLTTSVPDPFGYGRIVRGPDGSVAAIVEERDATPDQRQIREINPGFYCFFVDPLLQALGRLSNANAQREYYLTEVVGIQKEAGLRVDALLHDDWEELRGINTRRELFEVSHALARRKKLEMMASGVTIIDPEHTYVGLDVAAEKDAVLYPGVTLEGSTRIGEGSVVRRSSRISNSTIGPDVEILDSCVITDSVVERGSRVGPFARLRNRAVIGENCRVGNFVEIKKSTLGAGTKAAHLAYLGDAVIGRNVNIGAGVITCNYDGVRKSTTIIEDGAFVGTDAQLVAPVRIGQGAYVAAGSCITEDVPAGALAIARSRQVAKEGWEARKRRPTDAE